MPGGAFYAGHMVWVQSQRTLKLNPAVSLRNE
jgi:hypothetical protein